MKRDKRLADQVALVTGASRGIGRAIAVALAENDVRVCLVARSASKLTKVADEIAAAGGNAMVQTCDVSIEDDVRKALGAVQARWGRLDILVNCAGIGVFKPLLETSAEEWDHVMAVNARGSFLMCREAVPLIRSSQHGCIVNVASVVGVKGYVNQAAYTASKHALMGMTKVLAQELQPEGIRVHAVCPGGVDTELVADARPDLDRSVLMTPEEIAEIVVFLVRQQGRAIVDQINVRRSTSSPWFC